MISTLRHIQAILSTPTLKVAKMDGRNFQAVVL
jgi:hypothetical protein